MRGAARIPASRKKDSIVEVSVRGRNRSSRIRCAGTAEGADQRVRQARRASGCLSGRWQDHLQHGDAGRVGKSAPSAGAAVSGHIDINQFDRGHHFDELKQSFVIFICKYDPFGKGLYRYAFENICRDADDYALNDEAYKLFFNTTETRGDISENLRSLLEYMNDTKAYPVEETDCDLVKKIEQAVGMAKKDNEWRRAFMTYQIHQRAAELRGEERGEKCGEHRAKMESAKRMLLRNLPVESVVEFSGLSIDEVKAIKSTISVN